MQRYVDKAGWKEFEEFDAQELHLQTLVSGNVNEVYDAWIETCWKCPDKHGFRVLQLGTGRGQAKGCIRMVPGGIQEEIISVGEPVASQQDLIPSISYRVIPGPFPVKRHLGLIQFIPDSTSSSTLVCWDIKYEPSIVGSLLCCGGSLISLIARIAIQPMLEELANRFHK